MHRSGKNQRRSPVSGDDRSSGTPATRCPGARVPARAVSARRRRGYILIIVLGLTAVITALGLAFLDSHSTVMPEAFNRYRATRARYLAESGVDIATHYLIWPPPTVSPGDYWHGATGIAIDATTDYTDVSVQQDAGDPNQFTVTAQGVAHDFDGTTVVGRHSVTAQVLRPFDGKWRIPYAYLGRGAVSVPKTVQIHGDIHANNTLLGSGWCQGNVSSKSFASWTGSGPPASVTSFAGTVSAPPASRSLYVTYSIRGNDFTAYALNRNDLNASQAATLNAIDMSATNPGRVIIAKDGDFTIKESAQLNGTLVVNGNLKFRDTTAITAVANYPALVVTGNLEADSDNTILTIAGSVMCGGSIADDGKSNVSVNVQGACTAGTFNFSKSDGVWVFQWDANYSVFWDFAKSGNAYPVTLLSWKEN